MWRYISPHCDCICFLYAKAINDDNNNSNTCKNQSLTNEIVSLDNGISVVNFDKYPSREYQRMWISTYLSARDYYTKKFNRSGYQCHHLQPSVRELNQNGYPSLSSFKSSFSSCPSNNIVNLTLVDGHNENTSTVDKWLIEANHFAMVSGSCDGGDILLFVVVVVY
ncbi:unnamed protein product [Trichobilharzia regenti]|nr:unnamed protein product [Trichobilharzia regenti]